MLFRSTEAELIAYTDFIGEGVSLKHLIEEITSLKVNLRVLQDNQSVMSILKTGVLSGKSKHASKHVRVRIAWIKERTDDNEFVTIYCPTDLMISDGLTKPKTANSHVEYCDMIGVVTDPRSDPSKERAEKNVQIGRAHV